MEIFKKYNSLECGINDDGNLFLGDDRSGYTLPNTPKNRTYIENDFERVLGYEYVYYVGKYNTWRKIVNGKGKWLAEDRETGIFFSITYEQARGFEPINPTGIENLARELGKMLLPKKA